MSLIRKPNVAIDGYAGCGKSSTAKAIAKKLKMKYVDTGAMYRAITLFFLDNKINIKNKNDTINALKSLNFSYELNSNNDYTLSLNNEIIDKQLRTKNVNENVSRISELKEVRDYLLEIQKKIANDGNAIMEGRDIGTHVMPDAEVKIFIIADMDKRIERRYKELQEKGIQMSKSEIEKNFIERDKIDSNRDINPLKKAEDAHILDTSDSAFDEQVNNAIKIVTKND